MNEENKIIESFKNYIKDIENKQDALYENEDFYKDDIEQNELTLKMLHSVLNLTKQNLKLLLSANNLIKLSQEEKERYKRLAEQNLKDGEEFKNNMCEHRCIKNNEILELQSKIYEYDKIIDLMSESIFDYEHITYVDCEQFKKCKQNIREKYKEKAGKL